MKNIKTITNSKKFVALCLEAEQYEKLSKKAKLESRTVASYIRHAILTALNKD